MIRGRSIPSTSCYSPPAAHHVARLETVSDWKKPYREGVVYYLRDGRVRGVLLWNVWEQVDSARKLIAEAGPFGTENLKGRLPT